MLPPGYARAGLLWLLALGACGDGGIEGVAGTARQGADPARVATSVEESPEAAGAPGAPDAGSHQAVEVPGPDQRQERLRREWERYEDVVVEHSVADLPEAERGFARRLIEAAALVEEIHLLQIHPSNIEWRDRIEGGGTELERRLFHRYQSPWCLDDPDPECNALSGRPPREYGRGLWPAGIGTAEVEAMGRLINGRELLSPYTVVERREDGRLRAVPFAAAPEIGPRMSRLAGKLREAAGVAQHPGLKRFLSSRADALESGSPLPFDASDMDWLRLDGPWEVTIGPYETYDCPRGIKALFQMWLGRVDEGLTAEVRRLTGDLEGLEAALAALLGQEAYGGRIPDPRFAPRAVDVWIAAGDARRERGAILAYHLPGRGRAADEGAGRSVVLANHGPPFAGADRDLASRMLAADQAALVHPGAALANVAFHELAHGLGLSPEARITDAQGRSTSLRDALRGQAILVEELKADALGMWLLGFEKSRGAVTADTERSRWASAVVRWLGLMRGPLTGTHGRMAAIQLGWHIEAGSLTWSPEEGRLVVDFDKMAPAAEGLAGEVLGIQLAGDHARARALVGRFIESGAGGSVVLRGALAGVRAAAVERAAVSAVRPPVLRYVVHDPDGA